ncbi:uncharacterized protein LOC126550537 [Aphis gossypii]|uniref:uncharacterized protein LOC126550537 n=1 Tax=Aphis gossypii TaxID=80765 RepID=UPI002159137E|nr:uncharacterized protein LOC126550537 [Aphis gossypii]
MVNKCSIRGCPTVPSKATPMHSIPKNEELGNLWLSAIRKVDINFKNSKYSKVCFLHFEENDYTLSLVNNKKVLKKNAVHSIFTFTKIRKELFPKTVCDTNIGTIDVPCLETDNSIPLRDQDLSEEVNNVIEVSMAELENSIVMQESNLSEEVDTIEISMADLDKSTIMQESSTSVFDCQPEASTLRRGKSPLNQKASKRKHYVGDFKLDDLDSPNRRYKYCLATKRERKAKNDKISQIYLRSHHDQQYPPLQHQPPLQLYNHLVNKYHLPIILLTTLYYLPNN